MSDTTHPLRRWRTEQDPKVTLEALADQIGSTKASLSRVETGDIRPAPDLMNKIVEATKGAVDRHDLRPDLFGERPKQEAA